MTVFPGITKSRAGAVIVLVATLGLTSERSAFAQNVAPGSSSPRNQELPAPPRDLPTLEQSRASLQAVREEYLRTLREREQKLRQAYVGGRIGSMEAIRLASRDVLTAELELASKPEDRVAILQKLVEVSKDLEKSAELHHLRPPKADGGPSQGLVGPGDYYTRKAERLKAEIALYRELITLRSNTK